MGTKRTSPDTGRKGPGTFSNIPCKKTGPRRCSDLDKRIKDARAALHDAIRRAEDKPLSRCPEVLQLSRELDGLIDEMHNRGQKK